MPRVSGVTLLENGNVVIGDRVAPFLKIFDSHGNHLRDLSRSGEGPGEYQYIYEMDWCAPGELSVFDADRRVHRYEGDMDFVSTDLVSLDAIGGGVGYHRDCHPNGYQIVTGWGDLQAEFKVGLYEATAPVVNWPGWIRPRAYHWPILPRGMTATAFAKPAAAWRFRV